MELQKAMQAAFRKLEAQGLSAYEVAGLREKTLAIEAKHQMVESFRRQTSRGIAIRVMKDGHTGFTSSTDLSPRAVEQAIQLVLGTMREVHPSDEGVLPPPQTPVEPFSEQLGRRLDDIPDDEKIRLALTLESAAIAADSRIAHVQHPRYEETIRAVTIMSSTGVRAEGHRGICCCELKAVATDGAESQGAFEFSCSPRFEDLDAEGLARQAARRALEKLWGRPVPAGRWPILLSPRAAAVMVRLVAPSFFADHVQRGMSVLASRRGARAYHPEVSIVDDGILPDGYASFPFDGEGIPCRRTVLVRNGTIEGWLYDGARAARDGVCSTGSCRREGVRKLPAIGVGNCFLKGGARAPVELVREAGRGIMVTDLIGIHTANTISGDFSLGAEGFLIEGGAVDHPVRGITIAGNVHELFSHVVAMGTDLRFFGEYGAPSILIEALAVGS